MKTTVMARFPPSFGTGGREPGTKRTAPKAKRPPGIAKPRRRSLDRLGKRPPAPGVACLQRFSESCYLGWQRGGNVRTIYDFDWELGLFFS